VVRDGALCLIYGCDPTVILQYDFDSRQAREIGRHHPPLALDHLRGGSQALAVPDGWLCLVHEVTVLPGGRRVYLHRFMHLDKDLRISPFPTPSISSAGASSSVPDWHASPPLTAATPASGSTTPGPSWRRSHWRPRWRCAAR
jgi:hypothetical protein